MNCRSTRRFKRSSNSKFGNIKVKRDGKKLDSKREDKHYRDLKKLQEEGKISNLEIHKKFVLIPTQYAESTEVYKRGAKKGQPKQGKLLEKECAYYADFTYINEHGDLIVEDTKSEITKKLPEYVIKRKLMLYVHGISVKEV